MTSKCTKFNKCKFANLYIKNNKSPWYIKYCNNEYRKCKRHIYCCNKFNTRGKSIPENYAPTGSLL